MPRASRPSKPYYHRPSFPARRAAAFTSAYKARGAITRAQRGYVRKAGYYGRFNRAAGNELKFYDETVGASVITTGGVTDTSMNNIPEGTGQSERLGRKCTVTSVHVRGTILLPAQTAATSTSNRVRVSIVWDKQCNGAPATWAGAGGPYESNSVDSFRNLENSSRFVVLATKLITLNAMGATASGAAYTFNEVTKPFEFNLKINIPLEFSGATGGLSEVRSNNLFICSASEDTGTVSTIQYQSRLRYKDN